MIPGVVFHSRGSWVDASYPVSGPPADLALIDTCVVHYTAAADVPDGDDPAKVAAFLRATNRYYLSSRGYAIGYRWAVDQAGGVWQLRGPDIRSAANRGHNDHTDPVLVLVDGDAPASLAATRAVRAVIGQAQKWSGRRFTIVGHGQLSGAATSCPGVGLRAQVAAGVFTPIPIPTDDDEDDMAYLAIPPSERAGRPWLYVSSSVRPATTFDINDGVVQRDMNTIPAVYRVEQYDALFKAAGL